MQQKIIFLLVGVILGFGLFFIFNLIIPPQAINTKINSSPECGVVTPFKYCGSNEYLCVVNCNICGCDKPQCTPLHNCTP